MSESCALCSLQSFDPEGVPTVSLVVEALNQVVQVLKNKEVADNLSVQESQKAIESCKSELACEKKIKVELKEKCASLEKSVAELQTRSDTYKRKFLNAQEALEKLHKTNQELSKKLSNITTFPQKDPVRSFPFKIHHDDEKSANDQDCVVLAPDTCCTQSANLEHQGRGSVQRFESEARDPRGVKSDKSEVFADTAAKRASDNRFAAKSSNLVTGSVRTSSKERRDRKNTPTCSVRLVDCTVDPDETRLVGPIPIDDDDDCSENFSIPSSPVLSSAAASMKKPSFRIENKKSATRQAENKSERKALSPRKSVLAENHQDVGSPSLLPSVSIKCLKFPLEETLPKQMKSSVAAKQVLSTPATKKCNLFDEDGDEDSDVEDPCIDYRDSISKGGLSFRNRSKANNRSISPIECEGTETDLQEKDQLDPCTSIDELFDKTEGNLEDFTKYDRTKEANETKLDCVVVIDPSDREVCEKEENSARNESGESIVISDDDDDEADDFVDPSWSRQPPGKRKRHLPAADRATSCDDSFNVVPKTNKGPGYKFQSVVRKRDDREKLNAKSCAQCEAYFSDLPPDQREKAMKEICRHRFQYEPPPSPEHYWELGLPNTQECKRRGYLVDEEDLPANERRDYRNRRRRKKPLQAPSRTKHDSSK